MIEPLTIRRHEDGRIEIVTFPEQIEIESRMLDLCGDLLSRDGDLLTIRASNATATYRIDASFWEIHPRVHVLRCTLVGREDVCASSSADPAPGATTP